MALFRQKAHERNGKMAATKWTTLAPVRGRLYMWNRWLVLAQRKYLQKPFMKSLETLEENWIETQNKNNKRN